MLRIALLRLKGKCSEEEDLLKPLWYAFDLNKLRKHAIHTENTVHDINSQTFAKVLLNICSRSALLIGYITDTAVHLKQRLKMH